MACATGTPDFSSGNYTLEYFMDLLEAKKCTTCLCPLEFEGHKLSSIEYFPSLGGNALFAAIFGICLVLQIFFGIRHKTWGYMIGMFGGLVLEVIGYIARVLMRNNMFDQNYFIMYLVCLTIGPAFLSASIYLTLSRIIVIFAPEAARFKPQRYTHIFISFDLFSLILQGAGGGIASTADSGSSLQDAGVNLMIAGVAWQVASLGIFAGLCIDFFLRVRPLSENQRNRDFAELRAQASFKWFIYALCTAVLLIFVRSVFRCAELSQGFDGPLANDEVTFMVLEGTMIAVAVIALTAFHPAVIVGGERWRAASWKSKGGAMRKIEEADVIDGERLPMTAYSYKSSKNGNAYDGVVSGSEN